MAEIEKQHRLDRVRRRRPGLTYDVEINGVTIKKEMPYVICVLADMAGSSTKQGPFASRRTHSLDRDSFDRIFQEIGPSLNLKIPYQKSEGEKVAIELHFKDFEDFQPIRLQQQVPQGQLDQVLEHPDFQQLHQTWQGIRYLLYKTETSDTLKLQLLHVRKRELLKDLETAGAIDQSRLFHHFVASRWLHFQPMGLFVVDFEFDASEQDVQLLTLLSQFASEYQTPLVAAASPRLFQSEHFSELHLADLENLFRTPATSAWKQFRHSDKANYVALTLPRVQMMDQNPSPTGVWINSAYVFAACVADAVASHWWPSIMTSDINSKVSTLPCKTDCRFEEAQAQSLADQGFMPLTHRLEDDTLVFHYPSSCQLPPRYRQEASIHTAHQLANFNFLLYATCFVHYLEVQTRVLLQDKSLVGCQQLLSEWLQKYQIDDEDIDGIESDWRYLSPLLSSDSTAVLLPDPDETRRIHLVLKLRPLVGKLMPPMPFEFIVSFIRPSMPTVTTAELSS